jgi:uncharacterized protein YeaO (DUF488 family)
VITIARVYDNRSQTEAISVLVDRVWPRGVRKEKAGVDLWIKEIAPSDDLRKWFNHEDTKWTEFRRKYFAELDGKMEIVRALRGVSKGGNMVLLYSARNTVHNNAVALKEYLETHLDTASVDLEH